MSKNINQETSSSKWLYHDLLTLSVINIIFVGGLVALYFINRKSGILETVASKLFGF